MLLCLDTSYNIEFKFTKYDKYFDKYHKTKSTYPYISQKLMSSTYKNKLTTSCLNEEL